MIDPIKHKDLELYKIIEGLRKAEIQAKVALQKGSLGWRLKINLLKILKNSQKIF